MSDVDDNSSDEDFSVSEDEWKPNQNDPDSSEIETDEGNGDITSIAKIKSIATMDMSLLGKRVKKKKIPRTLRKKIFHKYKTPQTGLNMSKRQSSSKLSSSTSQNCPYSNSDSSGDDYLVDPNELDLNSSFFDIKKNQNKCERNIPPNFDCNAGMQLLSSTSSEIPENIDKTDNVYDNITMANKTCNKFDFNKLHKYAKNFEIAKEHLTKLKTETIPVKEDSLDVLKLLELGETSTKSDMIKVKDKKRTRFLPDSGSDWEEVQDTVEQSSSLNNVGLEVTVQLPQHTLGNKKTNDVEAMFKRKLNRVIKENQLYCHKVSLLCYIAHGNYTNKVLNSTSLMSDALKLLPNTNCYPNGRTEIKYFQSMIRWYKTVMQIKSNEMYSSIENRPKLFVSLALQIKYKEAICKKDYVLIFIILLRAMGIQCRLVMNLTTLPIKPLQSELCSLKSKVQEDPKSKKLKTKKHSNKETDESVINLKKYSSSTKKKNKIETSDANKSSLNIGIKSIKNKLNLNEISRSKLKSENHEKVSSKKLLGNKLLKKQIKILKDPNESSTQKIDGMEKNQKNKKEITPRNLSKPNIDKSVSSHFLKRNSNIKTNNKEIPSTSRTTRSKAKSIPQLDGNDDKTSDEAFLAKPLKKSKIKIMTRKRKSEPNKDILPLDLDDDFVPSPPKQIKKEAKSVDRRVLSSETDSENDKKLNKNRMDVWVEVFSEYEDQWVTLDLFKSKVHCIDDIRKSASPHIAYVFVWNNDNTLKDVSARYCHHWNTVTRKLRVDQTWLDKAICSFRSSKTSRDIAEDKELQKIHLDKPLPQTISEYKNHPLYVLERHLLKFEGIYPENALTLGYVRGEPVYARECVHTLHSREIWLKSARVVKLGEQPYKVVKARPKWDKYTSTVIKDQPLEIFGYWQTMDYEPPTAENGIVPRNAYGNVELFKACMLPKKTVHLQLPGLNRICKKLKIDCAPAVIGFDFHQGMCHPMLDGFVVCEEYAEFVTEAWFKDQEEIKKREEEKYLQRVYGNWKKLIRGLFIREKLKRKYNFEGDAESKECKIKIPSRNTKK